jgi:ribonuclease HI
LDEDVTNLGDDCTQPYLTKEDYENSLNTQQPSNKDEDINNTDFVVCQETTDSIMAEVQPRYNLRSKNKPALTFQPKKILPRGEVYEPAPKETDTSNSKTKGTDSLDPKVKEGETQTKETKTAETHIPVDKLMSDKSAQTNKLEKKESGVSTKETDKGGGGFSLENEINKIKIPIPLVELAKNPVYRKQMTKAIGFSELESHSDVINLEDDKPNITFGPHFEGARDTVAPFYITLNVHDRLLHNCMLDSGASHNVMPKTIMDRLGLEITRPYGDLYSFDSRRVKCMGMIKDLVVTLAQVPVKSILMDVVIVDIPPKYGLLLSRSWGAKLGGSLQLDMTYATIPMFGGQLTRLYRETRLAYTVSDPQNPNNFPVYIVDQDLGNCILSFDDDVNSYAEENCLENNESGKTYENMYSTGIWKMFFDGALSCEGAGAGVLFVAPKNDFVIPFSYRLQWDIDYTNNVCEYEALVLGLEAARKLNIKNLEVYGDAELIVKQINRDYQAKHPRLRSYRNCTWDLMENLFSSVKVHFIPWAENQQADSLAKEASTFVPPTTFKLKYHIEVRHRPSIPNNIQHWQVFEG